MALVAGYTQGSVPKMSMRLVIDKASGVVMPTKEYGVWVLYSGQPLSVPTTDQVLEQIREERDLANLGTGE